MTTIGTRPPGATSRTVRTKQRTRYSWAPLTSFA